MVNHKRLVGLIISAQMAVLLAISAQLTIPIAFVPLTLQTLMVGIIATLLPFKLSGISIAIYQFLGLVGFPVFSGGQTGIAVILGPTGGYIWGFYGYCWLAHWLLANKSQPKLSTILVVNTIASLGQLLIGTAWLTVGQHLSLEQGLLAGLLPFIIPALLKILIVGLISQPLLQFTNRYAW